MIIADLRAKDVLVCRSDRHVLILDVAEQEADCVAIWMLGDLHGSRLDATSRLSERWGHRDADVWGFLSIKAVLRDGKPLITYDERGKAL
jgi:hypothetical protein